MPELPEQLAGLARAVAGTGPVPPGLDAERVRVVRGQLLRKRARLVARRWPGLAAELGDDFIDLVAPILRERPFDREEALAAGLLLAERVRAQGSLGPRGAAELARARPGAVRAVSRRLTRAIRAWRGAARSG